MDRCPGEQADADPNPITCSYPEAYGHSDSNDYAKAYGHSDSCDYAKAYGHLDSCGYSMAYGHPDSCGYPGPCGLPKAYGYPDSKCEVWVDVVRTDAKILVSVRDRGKGLPANFDSNSHKGLGMKLINAFAEQLAGKLEIRDHDPGVEFILTFQTHQITP